MPAPFDHLLKGNVLYRHGMRDNEAESPGPLARFADKYPFNFINVGLIHLALPNARINHGRRSRLQTCLSIFSRIFTTWRSAATSASWAAVSARTMR
ncbi:sulfotransferase [Paraburkholderia sp. Cpub6]|uniref:sulfotransferase n=1 Tax=Paraburkholderia sp. Cpub6 TaxID=2723094 RepID=UPI00183BD6FB|nr:sulfotransferase [Paraburkholderia sp. Cpub6]MBB5459436.1 hypothetical protein [Paraburkholderia sp. Cpub6]